MLASSVLFRQKLAETKPLADLLKDNPSGQGKKIQAVFGIETRLDKERAIKLVKNAAISSWHPIGTCAMLPCAEGGVVDHCLRVYGTRGLRVVDASVMPMHVKGNIASLVYAIAEKAADLIREDMRTE